MVDTVHPSAYRAGMEHRFTNRPDADAFVAEHHVGAEPMPAVTALLGDTYLLDRASKKTVRIVDFSDDADEPVVFVNVERARDFAADTDLCDQVTAALKDHAERAGARAVLDELGTVYAAGFPAGAAWGDTPDQGVVLNLQSVHAQLEQALATVAAVRDAAARSAWEAARHDGATLESAAKGLHLERDELADMIAADRRRFLDL